ncbi:peptidase inhibitor family I36 protein [Micromonospora saelicesensis]|uniref:Peptidase inhibitor family I36 n=1 Tax=Micromonospora saelicesensis TaxID=285676 RepID=A0A1C4X1G4_9ACTN|nr:peptidase inhibitor family I36 protein [Micromonospora saelicesensis]RAN92396.1 hypothetical protein GAR05_05883 [Micromonospora saelicesensis]RAO49134.1 hypothetical protein PSN01_04670 [Micromonospora saelicesensis]RAO59523.1 hypothetical protein LUPAC06_01665 [Micromonospora saelicesensis]SCF02300.1 hypothetical protein GA0070561_3020 [Micromonospora saelicesensis]
MTKKLFATLAVAATASFTLAVPAAAQADGNSALARCSSGRFCNWTGANFSGSLIQNISPTGTSVWCVNMPTGTRSMSNGTNLTLSANQNRCENAGGSATAVSPGQDRGSFSFVVNSVSYCGVCRQNHAATSAG